MECKRCGNKDPAYFYKGHKGWYCRKCIGFNRVLLEEEIEPLSYEISQGVEEYQFQYELTPEQKKASRLTKDSLLKGKDVLLHCVCGAGKTEISVESIAYYLSKGLKVAYAISRKEVVIELEKRFRTIFPNAKVIGVYGNHHSLLTGDLIICTCHQLYRYHHTFDLLVLDEVDAFPLKGNKTLMEICLRSCKGRIIFSTATVNNQLLSILNKRNYETVELYIRPNHQPLIVPKVVYLPKVLSYFYLAYLMHSMTNQCIIFVSSKKESRDYYQFFHWFFPCNYVYSDKSDRKEVIDQFRDHRFQFLFSTTVLERGVTILGISVIILNFHSYFDEGNLIQMLGRVGRGIQKQNGKAYILSNHFDSVIKDSVSYLKKANSYL